MCVSKTPTNAASTAPSHVTGGCLVKPLIGQREDLSGLRDGSAFIVPLNATNSIGRRAMPPKQQAHCTLCGFTWTLDLQEPAPDASDISFQTYKKQAQGMRCPRCVRNMRETNFETIEIGER